ncbi:methyltransferase regulatory domain-containing protein [Roseospira navarrensis]|uniref:methyltransferase regulatory domain-containing protein n=1 Tax=Roseospira navarrensis TaxID=140058 RepID=UPI0014795622
MTTHQDGYVRDIPYTAGAYPALSPINLRLSALIAGVDSPPLGSGSVVWELGCGYGNGVISAAVAHPDCRFVGVDYNPAHIARARRRAADLGLRNIDLLDADVVDLAATPDALPQADLVVIHGVYGWVGAPVKAAMRELLRTGMRAGGLIYLSYNAMPGSGQMGVLQRALLEAARLSVGRSDARLQDAIARVEALRAAGAVHLSGEGLLNDLFQKIRDADPAYLVHEYMNETWSALYHSEVAQDMMSIGLTYAGSAMPHENFPDLMLTPAQAEALGDVAVPHVRETLRDMFLNRILRKDLYMRGLVRLSERDRAQALAAQTFCAACNPTEAGLSLRAPAGDIELPEAYRQAALSLWHDGPQPLSALMAGPMGGTRATPVEAGALLVSGGLAWPCLPPPGPEIMAVVGRGVALAAAAVRESGLGTQATVPAPRVGTEIPVAGLEAMTLDALWSGVSPDDTAALVEHIWAPFQADRESLIHRGERIEDPARIREILSGALQGLRPDRLPLWRGLGMLPGG